MLGCLLGIPPRIDPATTDPGRHDPEINDHRPRRDPAELLGGSWFRDLYPLSNPGFAGSKRTSYRPGRYRGSRRHKQREDTDLRRCTHLAQRPGLRFIPLDQQIRADPSDRTIARPVCCSAQFLRTTDGVARCCHRAHVELVRASGERLRYPNASERSPNADSGCPSRAGRTMSNRWIVQAAAIVVSGLLLTAPGLAYYYYTNFTSSAPYNPI